VYRKYLVSKGWSAIDGISLTVVNVGEDFFSVSLIPETLSRTTLGRKKAGDSVNLEFDGNSKIIVQTIERLLPNMLADMKERK
jgi:riboflavin synthase